ncbi:protein tyrosine phosphatase domain-containing protein 1-like [Asterias amurensis]|uniref:protein tyrosine phosphatase domain-containing protein 1-like n=1 Tax=Asterias amurensis TaxID=7602 RepID=UPI003AB676D3
MKSSTVDSQHPSESGSHISSIQRPTAKYGKLSNTVRQITPGPWQCAMFCGGKNCKHDTPARWTEQEMALNGLNSSWVGDDILAMARPSSEALEKFSIVEQFIQNGIKSVINLQRPGEHSSCGNPLQSSGFSYEPQQFMEKDVFFYNFGWDDYGIRSLPSILDMVKVMSFALKQGKVAVHCHAGLGRTGVLIACYLIYEQRMEGDNAIQFVREKRAGSIQTPGQIECCQQFAKFLIPFRVVFSLCDPCAYPFTLDQFLIRQKLMLHGYEARELKHLPKIVCVVCNRLSVLASCVTNQQPRGRHENIDMLKKTAPGAFPSQRESQSQRGSQSNNPGSPRNRRRVNDVPTNNKLPPLRQRSSSLENVTQDSLGIPQPNEAALRGRVSPMLDYRRNTNNGSVASSVSSSDDDRSVTAEVSPRQNAQFMRSHGNAHSTLKAANSSSSGRVSLSMTKRSSLTLSTLLIHDSQGSDDVMRVGTAMAFDASLLETGTNQNELSHVLQSVQRRVDSLQQNINRSTSAWEIVSTEEDPFVLSMLLWSWLEHLQKPFLSKADIKKLETDFDEDEPAVAFKTLNRSVKHTLDCILKTVSKLPLYQPHLQRMEHSILVRIIKASTHLPTAHLVDEDRSTTQQGEDGEDTFSLHNLLVMFKMYVSYLRSSDVDDTLSMNSQDSSVYSVSNNRAQNSPTKETHKKAPRDKKRLDKLKKGTSIPDEGSEGSPRDHARGFHPGQDTGESCSSDPSSKALLKDNLQRRKLRAIQKPLISQADGSSDDPTPLPRKSTLPPIF